MTELDHAIRDRIHQLLESGNQAFARGDYYNAAMSYREAWELIPAPRSNYDEETLMVGVALGEAYFFNGDVKFAKDIWTYLQQCPSGATNPYLHMRCGQAHYELGDAEGALEYFRFAFLAGGMEMLQEELRNGEHLSFIIQEMQLDNRPNDVNIVGDWEKAESLSKERSVASNRFSINTKLLIFSVSYSRSVDDRLFHWLNRCAGGVLVHGAIVLYDVPPETDSEHMKLIERELRWVLGSMMGEEVANILPLILEGDPQLNDHVARVLEHQEINAILARPDREAWDRYLSSFPK